MSGTKDEISEAVSVREGGADREIDEIWVELVALKNSKS